MNTYDITIRVKVDEEIKTPTILVQVERLLKGDCDKDIMSVVIISKTTV